MITIEVRENLLSKLPKLRLGCIEIDVCVNDSNDSLQDLLNQKIKVLETTLDPEIIRETATVKATKDAYRTLGKDPNRYRPAAESLMRRIAKSKGLYQISNVVDILNLISIETGFSICGYDKDKIKGNISFGIGEEGEPYEGIGRGSLNIQQLPVFRDELGAFGTPTSDSVRTMIDENTQHILFIFIDFEQSELLTPSIANCIDLLKKFAEGRNESNCILEDFQ